MYSAAPFCLAVLLLSGGITAAAEDVCFSQGDGDEDKCRELASTQKCAWDSIENKCYTLDMIDEDEDDDDDEDDCDSPRQQRHHSRDHGENDRKGRTGEHNVDGQGHRHDHREGGHGDNRTGHGANRTHADSPASNKSSEGGSRPGKGGRSSSPSSRVDAEGGQRNKDCRSGKSGKGGKSARSRMGEGAALRGAGGNSKGKMVGRTRQTVSLQLRVSNIQYDKLLGSSSVLAEFKTAIKATIATSASEEISPSHVSLQLSAGSVIVTATISPPDGVDAGRVSHTLSTASTTMTSQIALTIRQVVGIEDVSTGAIDVRLAKAPVVQKHHQAHKNRSEDTQVVMIAVGAGAGVLILVLLCLSVFLCRKLRTAKKRMPADNQSQKTTLATTAVMGSPMQEGKQDLDSVQGAMYAAPGSNDAVAVGYPINEKA